MLAPADPALRVRTTDVTLPASKRQTKVPDLRGDGVGKSGCQPQTDLMRLARNRKIRHALPFYSEDASDFRRAGAAPP